MWSDLRDQRLARSRWPIIVGPWSSELGFEILYWLPWLAAWREKWKIAPERLIVLTRGGAGTWYQAGTSVELYEYLGPDHLRRLQAQAVMAQASVKQLRMTQFDVDLVRVITRELGFPQYHVLHPSRMYQDLADWWGGTMGIRDLLDRIKFTAVPVPQPPLTMTLPDAYVTVRFYMRHTWPWVGEVKDWVANYVDQLAKRIPVVVLNVGIASDEHMDFPLSGPNIIPLSGVTTQNNLAVQSAIIAKSRAFVGTYGGTMQLAVRLKKPAIGFYQQFTGTAYEHKYLTEWLGVQQKTLVWIGRPEDSNGLKDLFGAL